VDKEVSVTILIMQRLHQDDPTGHMLAKGGNVKHICLPGELSDNVSPTELKENYIDGLLDPRRLSQNVLDELKLDLGSYGYSGQIQQSPSPMGGGIWQKWFIPVPDNKMDDIIGSLVKYGTDWDTAYTEKQGNSASAYVTGGKKDNDVYIDWIGYAFKEFPDLIKYMAQQSAPHYIEKKASGKSAKQTLTNEGINAVEVDVSGGDKIARARMATPAAEAGRVFVRKSQLNMLYYDEKQGVLKFPNASHDDLADALSQSIQRLTKPQLGFV
jgi:predicted phage terminase large subunit-like protein